MSKTLNPTITITVSGPTGSGKSSVLARIADALRLWYDDEAIIDSLALKAEKEMCGNDHTAWHKPRSGTIFKLKEVNLPGSLQKRTIRGMSHSEVMAWFEEYGFRDKVGHPLTLNLDFRELLYLALDHQGKPYSEITVDDLVDRPVPVHVQALMSKLGISFEEETDLQPVVDLVNWALMTPKLPMTQAEEVKNKQMSATEIRKYMVSELVELMSPENQPWHLPDAIQAVVAALLTLHDRDLIFMELRKFINPSCN
ncbi:hypothetical protein AA464_24545 [Salmonella enterica subsp. enterica serovar Newport]|nr:hypothetical protein [Salmonella enterica subsp. enterica serovar Newport]